jgi:hypothetical protein
MSEVARRSLEELQTSILFAPKRITYARPQYFELAKSRSAKMHAPGLQAIERARDQILHLRNLVSTRAGAL